VRGEGREGGREAVREVAVGAAAAGTG